MSRARIERWLVAAVLVAMGSGVVAEEGDVWRIGERQLPPPAGASEVLRETLSATPQPDVSGGRRLAPGSVEEWETLIARRAESRQPLEALEKSLGVAITRDVIDGVNVHRVRPAAVTAGFEDNLFLYIHGGAYVFGGGDAAPGEGAMIAATAGIEVLSVDYRMPPAHPFPAAVDDVVSVYRQVLKQHAPGALAMGGTSAGGGLTLAAVHRFKALGLPVPGALYAGTPWADLTKTGDTLYSNEGIDRVLVSYEGVLESAAVLYANGTDLTDPLLSPVYGDFSGFPPTYLVTGTRDMFLSDTARTHMKLRAAGVTADLMVFEALSHAGYAFVSGSPEQALAYGELAAFLERHLD